MNFCKSSIKTQNTNIFDNTFFKSVSKLKY